MGIAMPDSLVIAHMACSLLSYAAFLIACVSGTLFLLQERQLKRKRMGLLFHRLPSLEALDRINFLSIGMGFGLLSVGALCGFVGAQRLLGRWWTGDPKAYATVILWAAYLVLWLVRLRSTLRGRRLALLSMLGFSLVVLAFVGVTWFLPSGHPYLSS
jgi:ABC-type transport system involved in cytochrome c biogenesis permease subunit